MRIGVNTLFMIPHEVGGTETYLRELLKAMAPCAPDNTFALFTNADNDAVLKRDLVHVSNVEFVMIPFSARRRPERILREQFQLPWIARRAGVEVLWSPGNVAPLWGAYPQVVTIHDMQYKSHPDDLKRLDRWVTDFLVQQAVRRCDRVVTPSEFSKREVVKYTGVSESRVVAALSGVNAQSFAPRPPAECERALSGIAGLRKPYLLCVSNSYPHKNLDNLVSAFARIESQIPHQLVLVGQPRLGEEALRAALAAVQDPVRVLRLRGLGHDVLGALYQSASLFLFPSVYEGFGLPVLEAMLARVPVVTTRCGSIPEVGGDAVFYAASPGVEDLAGSILQALTMDARSREQHVERAVGHASKYTWDRAARAILSTLEGVARGLPKTRGQT